MAKLVNLGGAENGVEVYGLDMGRVLSRWSIDAPVGELVRGELEFPASDRVIRIEDRNDLVEPSRRRVVKHCKIYLSGDGGEIWTENIGRHVDRIETVERVGQVVTVILGIHVDPDVFRFPIVGASS